MANPLTSALKKATAQLPKKKSPASVYASQSQYAQALQNSGQADTAYMATRAPAITAGIQAYGGVPYAGQAATRDWAGGSSAPAAAPSVAARSASSGGGSSGGSRGYGGGGGGGGGGAALQQQYDAAKAGALYQIQMLLEAGKSSLGQYQPDVAGRNNFLGTINSAVDKDLTRAGSTYDALDQTLGQVNAVNPYAGMQARPAVTGNNGLSAYLASQGGDVGQLDAGARQIDQMGQQQAGNWNGLYASLQGAASQQAGSRTAQAAQARAYTTDELAAQRAGLLAQGNARYDAQDAAAKQRAQAAQMQLVAQVQQILAQANGALPFGQQLAAPSLAEMGIS